MRFNKLEVDSDKIIKNSNRIIWIMKNSSSIITYTYEHIQTLKQSYSKHNVRIY